MPAARFRPIDLFVSLAVVVSLTVVVAGSRRAAEDDSNIISCANRMSQLAQSLVMYQGLYAGEFPRTRYDPAAPLTAYTKPDAPNPFAPDGPDANDVTAAFFLLARVMELPPDAFTCPAAIRNGLAEEDEFDRKSVKTRSNFRSRVNDNFSLANMYPDAAATAAGYSLSRFREKLPATFVIASDTNPGEKATKVATTQMSRREMRAANSPNHQRDGQNVMFADGSVQFFNAPFVGTNYDNVFTSQSGDTRQPAGPADTVLLPVWSDGPQVLATATLNRRWVLGVGGTAVIAVMVWIVRHGVKNNSPKGRAGVAE